MLNIPGITINAQNKTLFIEKDILDNNLTWYLEDHDAVKFGFVKIDITKVIFDIDKAKVFLEFKVRNKDQTKEVDIQSSIDIHSTFAELKSVMVTKLQATLDALNASEPVT